MGPMVEEYGPVQLKVGPDRYAASLKKTLAEVASLAREKKIIEAKQRLSLIGLRLFGELPPNLQSRLWFLQSCAKTFQIISNEPDIPWEMMKLQVQEQGKRLQGPYLCEQFAVTRWLHKMVGSTLLPVKEVALIVPQASGLPEVEAERADLLSLAGPERKVHVIEALYLKVVDALSSGAYDAWHFCGHAQAKGRKLDEMSLPLNRGELPLRPEVIQACESIGNHKALVFLNACETGGSGFTLTHLGGWAPEFLEAGAGAFLGTLWFVEDRAAREFAKEFYRRFLGGEPIAEALRQTRLHIRDLFPGDPSWLAYTAFAHPFAKCEDQQRMNPILESKRFSPSSASIKAASLADLEIRIRTIFHEGEPSFEFALHFALEDIDLEGQRFTVPAMSKDERSILLDRIDQLNRGFDSDGDILLKAEAKDKLDGIGRELYRRLFPPGLRQAYRQFRKHVRSLTFVTDEIWVPWELIKAYDDIDLRDVIDDDFLCLQFQMSRWLSGASPPLQEIRVQRFAFIGAEDFPHSGVEREFISSIFAKHSGVEDVSPSEPTLAALEDLLAVGGTQLLHFAGRLVDRTFRPEDLHGPRTTWIRRDRPLVFFNLNGEPVDWIRRWVDDCDCGAFLYPLWRINDRLAYEFATAFYSTLSRGETFGRAVQDARRKLYALDPGVPTWLAYTFYGNVNGRFSLGALDMRDGVGKD